MLTFMALEEQAARASVNPWQMTMTLSVDNRGPSLDLDLVCKATKTNPHPSTGTTSQESRGHPRPARKSQIRESERASSGATGEGHQDAGRRTIPHGNGAEAGCHERGLGPGAPSRPPVEKRRGTKRIRLPRMHQEGLRASRPQTRRKPC